MNTAETLATIYLLQQLQKQRQVVQNLFYRSSVIPLDGYHFINCRFDDCILASQTGDFVLTRCAVGANTRLHLSLALTKGIQLYHLIREAPEGLPPRFCPKKNPDGSISIEDVV